ncbi:MULTISPECIES: cyclic lactone autoinducer peptide [unclassified Candidatus Frackibacter]|nr:MULTISPECIES: cyclic lactone autoinducer peptide [unclassified Candidatus Frackibacter]KXS42354.1 MAG: hypothetical protein AWU54_1353 [Candidatus Frackibacter sp. T328-2]SDC68504.1 cyclic lactone autoinducer peptide [Candidatus Frackibacter sp. WG11]SEM83171.1 cyclic lactone autoinducer peptide [Candidatus Frackibacter sp. WG12]SFL92109.1 cyclic lactone autoinducer peptide [Candidatus Frackibacter sp. WG13]
MKKLIVRALKKVAKSNVSSASGALGCQPKVPKVLKKNQ